MKTVLIIGLGRFGIELAKKFISLGCEVMIVDQNEDNIDELVSISTNIQIGDCTKLEVLKSIGVSDFDLCYVCIGEDFRSSLIITALLKDLGAKRVLSKAGSKLHEEFLLRNGADEVIYAEKVVAEKYAIMNSSDNYFDFMQFSGDYSIFEIEPKQSWIGKTIAEVNVRNKFNISILAVKNDDIVLPMPGADHMFEECQRIMIFGKKGMVEKMLD